MLSIDQALRMEVFSEAAIVAGRGGLNKPIQWVHVIDVPEVEKWVSEGVLLFTTAFGLKDRPDLQETLIPQLVRLGVVGMVVSVGQYIHEIPSIMIQQANELDFPILTLPWKLALIEVMRPISEFLVEERYALMQRSIEVHNVLTQVVLSGADLNELAGKLASLVKCPVTIEDPSFRVLAYSTFGEVDQAREESILHRLSPTAVTDELARQGLLTRIRQSLHPTNILPLPELGMTYERIVAPIIGGGDRLGYVWLIAHSKLTGEMDMVTVEHAATVAALILLRERAVYEAEQRLKSSLLDELLHSPLPIRADLVERVRPLGLGKRQQAIILRLREAQPQPQSLLPVSRLVKEQLRLAGRCGTVVERAQNLVILVESDDAEQGLKLANAIFAAGRQQNYTLSIGVGRATESLDQLPASYQQALEALETGMVFQDEEGGVILFDDLGVLHWLHHLPDEIRTENTFHQAICLLAQLDADHKNSYVHTLQVYLDSGSNAQQAAERLYLHRNTLSQRLSKIEALTRLNLHDPNVLLNLNIALKAWRLRSTQ